jgi:hypothetical protein
MLTRLSRDPDANDWSIHEDGQEIGRLYEDRTARAELTWFWSITVMGPARQGLTDGCRRSRGKGRFPSGLGRV